MKTFTSGSALFNFPFCSLDVAGASDVSLRNTTRLAMIHSQIKQIFKNSGVDGHVLRVAAGAEPWHVIATEGMYSNP